MKPQLRSAMSQGGSAPRLRLPPEYFRNKDADLCKEAGRGPG